MVSELLKRYVDKVVMPLRRRVYSMLGRALVTGVIEGLQRQNLQLRIENDESADNIERFQNYGMTSYPPIGSEAIVMALKGSLDQRVAIAVEKKDLRPKGEPNDVIVYHAEGHQIRLTSNGQIIVTATDVILEAASSFTIISPETLIQGPLHVTGGISTDLGIFATGGITSASVVGGSDLTAGNVSYLGHKHRDAENRLTDTPTLG
ncbi:phage baseplate assembly protein V [Vibrio cholerae]|uniref:phage baseplate assembly protein V n=1 Tax=unclassified Vibrio TaxID=2614977 RepID=UPI0013724712|nr:MULTISPECIES: phage baseplate assembly protein V [unclassified Vibrio]NAX01431.1 phage baseplate assembly protein V [Vibrio sp. V34_P3A8T189]NAX07214.1 phage baseplate assembly protein V [Vibrio sp. V40_P2S30T141]